MDPIEPGGADGVVVLVPADSSGMEAVVYGLSAARDMAAKQGRRVTLRILQVVPPSRPDHEASLASSVAGLDPGDRIDVRFEAVERAALDGSGSAPTALSADRLARLIVDPRLGLAVEALRARFGTTTVELAPIERSHPRRPLLHPGGARRLGTLFVLTYGFYLAIGGFAGGLDLVTGAVSAAVVSVSLSHVALRVEPTLPRTGARLLRFAAFLPWLLWEIVRANVALAAVILHPALPIDPSVSRYETDTREPLERMILANAITLTPGTLVLNVRELTFTVHALTDAARTDLQGGRLAAVVSWVFHGRTSRDASGGGAE